MTTQTEVLESSRRELDTELLKPFLQNVGSYQDDFIFGVTAKLFHYTDLSGLNGIVSEHDLYLTHNRYCNDDEEMLHGYGVAREVVDAELAKTQDTDYVHFLNQLTSLLRQPVDVYICCFCKVDNLLSQWRGYGANGGGVSVCIDPNELRDLTGPDSPPGGLMRMWKVFYKPVEQREIIVKTVNFGFSRPGSIEQRAQATSAAIQFFVPTFKNKDFEDEKECRLIFTPSLNCGVKPCFRPGRGMLIPYYKLKDLRATLSQANLKLPIKGVRIGPSTNKLLNKASVSMLLDKDYPGVPVECSDTPYRG
jgi:hypothetical protein